MWGLEPTVGSIETWINRETLASQFAKEFDLSFLDGTELKSPQFQTPCTLFNGQVAPLVPFTFGGMIWYQGEANRGRAEQYIRLQKAYAHPISQCLQTLPLIWLRFCQHC